MFSFFPLQLQKYTFLLKETQWERTSPVFPDLAAGRKKRNSSILQALPQFRVSQTTHLRHRTLLSKGLQVPCSCTLVPFQKYRAHHVIHLQQTGQIPRTTSHKNKLKPPVLVSFAEAHHEAFPQPEKSGFSSLPIQFP